MSMKAICKYIYIYINKKIWQTESIKLLNLQHAIQRKLLDRKREGEEGRKVTEWKRVSWRRKCCCSFFLSLYSDLQTESTIKHRPTVRALLTDLKRMCVSTMFNQQTDLSKFKGSRIKILISDLNNASKTHHALSLKTTNLFCDLLNEKKQHYFEPTWKLSGCANRVYKWPWAR